MQLATNNEGIVFLDRQLNILGLKYMQSLLYCSLLRGWFWILLGAHSDGIWMMSCTALSSRWKKKTFSNITFSSIDRWSRLLYWFSQDLACNAMNLPESHQKEFGALILRTQFINSRRENNNVQIIYRTGQKKTAVYGYEYDSMSTSLRSVRVCVWILLRFFQIKSVIGTLDLLVAFHRYHRHGHGPKPEVSLHACAIRVSLMPFGYGDQRY